jgi:hypothetical protein
MSSDIQLETENKSQTADRRRRSHTNPLISTEKV